MTENKYIPLPTRAIIGVSGDDSANFLQGLISNDIKKVTDVNAIYALLLTPQGKFLYDFFITKKEDVYYIDCVESKKLGLIKHLSMYKLRSKVVIEDLSDEYEAVALVGEGVFDNQWVDKRLGSTKIFCKGVAYIDPRNIKLFARVIIAIENEYQSFTCHDFTRGDVDEYHRLRIENKIADGEFDMVKNKSFPMHFNMKKLNAIDLEKGCYVGQEVVTRSYHRSELKKDIYLLKAAEGNTALDIGSDILWSDKKVGVILSSVKELSLAQLDIKSAKEMPKDVELLSENNIFYFA